MRELVLYQHYAAKRLLPSQRVVAHLAQVALMIAKTNGGAKNASIQDFILQTQDEVEIPENEAADFFGFAPTITRGE